MNPVTVWRETIPRHKYHRELQGTSERVASIEPPNTDGQKACLESCVSLKKGIVSIILFGCGQRGQWEENASLSLDLRARGQCWEATPRERNQGMIKAYFLA